jgi:3-hydroxypropanoate dehydrogenase
MFSAGLSNTSCIWHDFGGAPSKPKRRRINHSFRKHYPMTNQVNQQALDALFLQARTHNGWLDKPVDDTVLKHAYELARMGPTSANCCPMRIVFVRSREAKERLMPALMEGNRKKSMAAPAVAIIGHDSAFYELLPRLFPQTDARAWFAGPGKEEAAAVTAFRNGSLQGAYFMLAARALGLDCGPMSGFDNAAVDREFFPGGRVKSNFICNLGYGDPARLFPRNPRLEFDEACSLV